MNVLIAKTIQECEQWADTAVVVDVLSGTTAACVLLERGKKDLLVFESPDKAVSFAKAHSDFEIYSDMDLPEGLSHEEVSPFVASKASSRKPALLITETCSKAVMSARAASTVLLGGFCNFYELAATLSSIGKDVLLIPSALFGYSDDVEDGLCVDALKDYIQGIGRPEESVLEFNNTMRYGEFMNHGPKTAEKDAKIAFGINGVKVVPQVTFVPEADFAVCHLYGKPAPEVWAGTQAAPEGAAQDPAEDAPNAPVQTPREPAMTETTSRIKSFFSDILHSSKDDKAKPQAAPEEAAPAPVPAVEEQPEESSDDLLDSVLKHAPEKQAETPSAGPQVKNASAQVSPAPQVAPKNAPEDIGRPLPRQTVLPAAEVTFSGKMDAFGGKKQKKAIVLFSGGLDSTTCLYWALAHGYECETLTVSYGQRHDREVVSAEFIARKVGVKHHSITLDLPWLSSSSLVDKNKTIPDVAVEDIPNEGIPSTYVPGRNLMFLSIAGSLLDSIGADAIIAGPNAVDFSGYPDCTPAFFKAAADALNRGTSMGVSEGVEVLAPLMRLSKAQIVQLAVKLKVPFDLTWSCYAGGKKPCGHCDSCKLRAKGFEEAGVHDTALD